MAESVAAALNSPPDIGETIRRVHHSRVKPLLGDLQQRRSSKVVTYFLAPGAAIADDAVVHLFEHLRRIGHQDQIDLFLNSQGGATEVPWRLVSLLREFCDRFCVLLPYHAASAATHISLGADEIVMTEIAQLGPVDPSRQHPLLPPDPYAGEGEKRPLAISVQDLRHFIKFIEKEGEEANTVRPADATAIYVALMEHVHPLVIGAMEQSYALAKLITKNMLSLHMDPTSDADEIERLANHLSDDFKSHVYPINRKEARQMGLKVKDADAPLRDAMWALWHHYTYQPPTLPEIRGKISGTPMPSAYIDSDEGSSVAFALFDTKNQPVGAGGWVDSWAN
ncbi:MAG TPA: hypothetical protein VFA83_21180 [Acidimicrobiales bacterium]|nr:hypothetical protein [Acidimicrobiales bacterium]